MWLALALTNSAKPPSTVQPVTCCFEQSVSRPIEQNSHSPQVQCSHGTPTRSPASNPVTPSPIDAIVPATSCPSVRGNFVIGLSRSHSPIARCKSEWQTPQAATLINTSPGPGAGVGISSIRNASANECKTAAFKISPLFVRSTAFRRKDLLIKPLPPEGGTTNCLKANYAFARQRFDHLVGVIQALQDLPRVLPEARRRRLDGAGRGRKLYRRRDLFQSAFGRMLDLHDQLAMFDLRVFDHLGDVVDERDAGVDVFKRREPFGGRSGLEDFAERRNYLFLRAVVETFSDKIFAPQRAAGVLPEFMLQRAQAEIPPVFRLVDLIAGVPARQTFIAALGLRVVGQETRERDVHHRERGIGHRNIHKLPFASSRPRLQRQ